MVKVKGAFEFFRCISISNVINIHRCLELRVILGLGRREFTIDERTVMRGFISMVKAYHVGVLI